MNEDLTESDAVKGTLDLLNRGINDLSTRNQHLKGILDHQNRQMLQLTQGLQEFFCRTSRAVRDLEDAGDEEARQRALRDLWFAIEFGKKGLPSIRPIR